jgi:TPR repeat protein
MKRYFLLVMLLSLVCVLNAQDMSPSAVAEFKESLEQARAGDSNAQVNVGYDYSEGIGTPKNYQKAHYWYQKAAAQGNAYGIGNMGCLYKYGQYVKRDLAKAVKLLKEGGDKGNPDGYFELGDCYEKGLGVHKNLETAYMYYKKAADKGYDKGIKAVAALESRGIGVNGSLIARGTYTSTGVFKQNGQFSSSGTPYLTSFRIYEKCLYEGDSNKAYKYVGTETLDNITYRRYGSDRDNYFLVTGDGSVRKSWSFSANYPFLGVVRTTSIMYYDKGDTRAAYQQGTSSGGGSYSNGSSNSSSTSGRQLRTCGLCHGRGWVDTDEGVSDFGSNSKKWCSGCNKYVYMNHYHKTCPSCNGKGKW